MKKILPVWISFILLASCSAPTSHPYSALQLDSQIVQPNDLPSGCTSGQPTHTRNPSHFYDQYSVPAPDYYIGEALACGNFAEGFVQVFIYANPDTTSSAFQSIAAFLNNLFKGGTGKAVNLGDEAYSVESVFGETDLVVRHCHAVITVDQIGDLASMTAYAQRLDKRLGPVICR